MAETIHFPLQSKNLMQSMSYIFITTLHHTNYPYYLKELLIERPFILISCQYQNQKLLVIAYTLKVLCGTVKLWNVSRVILEVNREYTLTSLKRPLETVSF